MASRVAPREVPGKAAPQALSVLSAVPSWGLPQAITSAEAQGTETKTNGSWAETGDTARQEAPQ